MNINAVQWNDLLLFLQVVEQGGFTAAGDALGLPKSSISRRIARLEAQLGVRLLQRSSRKSSLTEAGHALLGHCRNMAGEASAGIQAIQERLNRPSGVVRLSLPVELAEAFSRNLLPRFMREYPQIRLGIRATNQSLDLLEEHIDVVVRGVGVDNRLAPSSLVQACVCTASWAMVCSSSYLERWEPRGELEALSRADSLLYAPNKSGLSVWRLLGDGGAIRTLPARVILESDNLAVLKQAALAGLGVTGLPLYVCADELKAGALTVILAPWRQQAGHLVVLFPSRRGLVPAARALVEFLKTHLPTLIV